MSWQATYAKRHHAVGIERPGPPPNLEDMGRVIAEGLHRFAIGLDRLASEQRCEGMPTGR
jgi:hypothetical protein